MLKPIRIIILLFMVFFLNKLYSDDNFEALFNDIESDLINGCDSPLSTNPLQISGEHEFIFSLPYINPNKFEAPLFNNTFKITYETEEINIVSTWKFNIPGNEIIPGENYIKLILNNTIFKVGYTLFFWGHADEQNPTDKLNSRDYTNALDITKILSPSVVVEQYGGDFSLNLVYIPVKKASLFSFDICDKIPETLINPENITFNETNEIEKFVLGGRINYYGEVDFTLSYIYNYDDFYIPEVDVNPDYPGSGTPLAGLVLKNQRIHQIGLSGKTIIDRFGIWLELNYSVPEVTEEYLEWTAGFDCNFGTTEKGFFNIQTFGKWCPYYIDAPDVRDISNYTTMDIFYRDILTGSLQNMESEISLGFVSKISYKLMNEELEPALVILYTKSLDDSGSFIIQPALTFQPIDSFAIFLGMNIVYSIERLELYEEIHKNDNIFLSVKYNW